MPVTSPETDLSEPRVDVLGMDADSMKGFDRPQDRFGKDTRTTGDLEENEIYLSAKTAEGLGVGAGDKIEASLVRPAAESGEDACSAGRARPRSEAAQGPPGGLA